MATKNVLQSLMDVAGQFVVNQHGQWVHEDWVALLTKVSEIGIPITDETKRNLGNILESCKYFYQIAGTVTAPEKKAAKPKAKPRAKKAAAE